MSKIVIHPLGPERFAAEVREGTVVTHHQVAMHDELLDELGLLDVEPGEVVRQTVEFLLERENAASLWEDFPVEQVADRYPGFYDELLQRLGG